MVWNFWQPVNLFTVDVNEQRETFKQRTTQRHSIQFRNPNTDVIAVPKSGVLPWRSFETPKLMTVIAVLKSGTRQCNDPLTLPPNRLRGVPRTPPFLPRYGTNLAWLHNFISDYPRTWGIQVNAARDKCAQRTELRVYFE